MSKRTQHINHSERELTLTALTEAAKRMPGLHPAVTFVNELLTESEKLTIGRRILIAQMILSGMSQSEINFKLNVSPNTFCRTRKWLEGQIPNYGDALKEFQETEDAKTAIKIAAADKKYRERKQYAPAHTFRGMQQRYPLHFLLFTFAEKLASKNNKR